MDNYMVKTLTNWKINECNLQSGAISDILYVSASLYINRKCMANNHNDIKILVENLVKNPATILPTYSMNKLLDENIDLREKLEKLQNELNEIRNALKIINEFKNGE